MRRGARRPGSEPEVTEQRLGHAVVALILLERAAAPVGESALPPEPGDQPQFLEGPEMGERRRGTDVQRRGDFLETRTARFVLPGRDDAQGLDLSMGQLLEGLHGGRDVSRVYIGPPNY